MSNDIPDWTGQNLVQLISDAGEKIGDLGAAVLAKDSIVTAFTGQPLVGGGSGAMASLAPIAGSVIAQVGPLGAVAIGTGTAVNPVFDHGTTAGNCGVAWVSASANAEPTCGTGGWVKAVSRNDGNGWNQAWIKPNCANNEAAPTFAQVGGTSAMFAVLGEFSNVSLAGTVDATGGADVVNSPLTITATVADVAFGNLVLTTQRWKPSIAGNYAFSSAFNNGAAVVHAGDAQSSLNNQTIASFDYAIIPQAAEGLPLGVAAWPYDAVGNTTAGAGTAATVTLAAVPGRTYRAALLVASMEVQTAGGGIANLSLTDGAVALLSARAAVAAAVGNIDRFDLVGVAFKGTQGNSMTWGYLAGLAGAPQAVTIGAYLQ